LHNPWEVFDKGAGADALVISALEDFKNGGA
jgi:hypothetical protein